MESAYEAFDRVLNDLFRGLCAGPAPDHVTIVNGMPKKFRGVTKHKRTQRYEAHIWESKKQIYLGGFDSEVLAARSHDIMALRCKGENCETLNFPRKDYASLIDIINKLSKEDIIVALRNYSKTVGVSDDKSKHTFKLNTSRNPNHLVTSGATPTLRAITGQKRHPEYRGAMPETPMNRQRLAPKSPKQMEDILLEDARFDIRRDNLLYFGNATFSSDDNSLTYDAVEESYIFDSFAGDGNRSSLEHLSGAAILRDCSTHDSTENDSFLLESSKMLDDDNNGYFNF